MTEKRFHFGYVLGDTGLIDEQAEDKWFIENCCSCSDLKKNWITVCNKLNELADENEQLKNEEQKLDEKICLLTMDLIKTKSYEQLEKELNRIKNENEQLKQTIQDMRIRFKRKYDYEFDDIVDELD